MELQEEYERNQDFKEYVDKCCKSYNKDLNDMLLSPITREYCLSLQKGGCNERRTDRGNDC